MCRNLNYIVNRRVASSNLARGAKSFNHLRTFSESGLLSELSSCFALSAIRSMAAASLRTAMRLPKPAQNAFIESFNGKFRDECLNQNWFVSLEDSLRIIEDWRVDYNTVRPYSALGYRTPEEFARDVSGETGCGKDAATATTVPFPAPPSRFRTKPQVLHYDWTKCRGQARASSYTSHKTVCRPSVLCANSAAI